MSAIAGIGFLMKYILIPGQERWIKYGSNVGLYLFGLDRHEWGTIHLIIGFILLSLLVLHIILHWNAILNIYNKLFKIKTVKIIIAILFIIISAILIFIPFVITPDVIESERGQGRHGTIYNESPKSENNSISLNKEKIHYYDTSLEKHKHSNPLIEVKGFMTLAEVSKKYNVPSEIIKIKLNIPNSVSDNQKFGLLRNKYDFTMSDVEKIIDEYNTKRK